MVNIKLKYNFVEAPRKFIIIIFISTDEDPSLRIESLAIVNLGGISTKLYFNYVNIILGRESSTFFVVLHYSHSRILLLVI